MENAINKLTAALLAVLLAVTLTPIVAVPAWATDSISYLDWDETTNSLVERTKEGCETIAYDSTVLGAVGAEKWYKISENVTISYHETEIIEVNELKISGNTHVILCDSKELKVCNTVTFNDANSSLTIHSQSTGAAMGKLTIDSDGNGVNNLAGSMTVNGGEIKITGESYGVSEFAGGITVNGGNLTITGDRECGVKGSTFSDGDGITVNGGSLSIKSNQEDGFYSIAPITVSGGALTITGANGIGGAKEIIVNDGTLMINGTNNGVDRLVLGISINGGIFTATGGAYGINEISEGSQDGDISIYEGTLIAQGGTKALNQSLRITMQNDDFAVCIKEGDNQAAAEAATPASTYNGGKYAIVTTGDGYKVDITEATGIRRVTTSGAGNQRPPSGSAITDMVFQARDGYYFPATYASIGVSSGIAITRDSDRQITVSGTPTADVSTTLTAATLMPRYNISVTTDTGITWVTTSGAMSQSLLSGSAISDMVFEAADGYYFPATYASIGISSGIAITRDSDRQITVSGTPTADVSTTLTAATLMPRYNISVTTDTGITWVTTSGAMSQSLLSGSAISDMVFEAVDGYYFPATYASIGISSGIAITRDSDRQITVSGTPTTDVTIDLAPAVAKPEPETTPSSVRRRSTTSVVPPIQPAPTTPNIVASEYGNVETNPLNPKPGDAVVVKITPKSGYQLARINVYDEKENKISIYLADDAAEGEFIFTQPEGNVKIEPIFVPVPEPVLTMPTVLPSPQTLTVNGSDVVAEAYNIGGTNFFKLRDLAAMLSGTSSRFSVTYDAVRRVVVITSGEDYDGLVGSVFADNSGTAMVSPQKVEIDGRVAELTAYNIGGSNFFGLRELAPFIGYEVTYDETSNTAGIGTE